MNTASSRTRRGPLREGGLRLDPRHAAVDLAAVGVPLDGHVHQSEAVCAGFDTSLAIRMAPAQVPNTGLRRPNSAIGSISPLVFAAA